MHDTELSPEVAAQVDALLDSIDLEPLARALVGAVAGAWERRLAERESHFRGCPTCSVGGPDGMCPEGRRLDERVSLAMTETTAATAPRTAEPDSGATASTSQQEVSRQHETRTTPGRTGRSADRGNPCAATTSTIRRDSETPDRL